MTGGKGMGKTGVAMVFIMKVNNPTAYVNAYKELTEKSSSNLGIILKYKNNIDQNQTIHIKEKFNHKDNSNKSLKRPFSQPTNLRRRLKRRHQLYFFPTKAKGPLSKPGKYRH